jgi:hypothetical protein
MRTRKQKLEAAVNLTLKVWTYLRDHSYIFVKADLPEILWEQIGGLSGDCPLCEIFQDFNASNYRICKDKKGNKCPLYKCYKTHTHVGLYDKWSRSMNNMERAEWAGKIVDRLLLWKKKNKLAVENHKQVFLQALREGE